MAKPKKRRKTIIFTVIGLGLVALTGMAMFRKRDATVTVQTEKVSRRNLTEIVVANGKIQPVIQVKISPEVSGEIIQLPVKEGECLQKGDLILKIKPDFYTANLNQAEASYKSSLAARDTAEANLHKAKAEFRRNEDLFRNKLISESVFDEFKAAFDVATVNPFAPASARQTTCPDRSTSRSGPPMSKTLGPSTSAVTPPEKRSSTMPPAS